MGKKFSKVFCLLLFTNFILLILLCLNSKVIVCIQCENNSENAIQNEVEDEVPQKNITEKPIIPKEGSKSRLV